MGNRRLEAEAGKGFDAQTSPILATRNADFVSINLIQHSVGKFFCKSLGVHFSIGLPQVNFSQNIET